MLPIHVLESIKKRGEDLAKKEKELLEIRKQNKCCIDSIQAATDQLPLVQNELKQQQNNLTEAESENMLRNDIEIRSVQDELESINDKLQQLKLEASQAEETIKENEKLYAQKSLDFTYNYGLLSKETSIKRINEMKSTCEAYRTQKLTLESNIILANENLKKQKLLETELETSSSFRKFVEEEIFNTDQKLDELQQHIQILVEKRDDLRDCKTNNGLHAMEDKILKLKETLQAIAQTKNATVNHHQGNSNITLKLRKNLQEIVEPQDSMNSTVQCNPPNSIPLCNEKIKNPAKESKKFKFMPVELND